MVHRPTTYFGMEGLVLPGHEQNTTDFPSHLKLSGGEIVVHFEQALTNPGFEIKKG